jgi:hypothetical protein
MVLGPNVEIARRRRHHHALAAIIFILAILTFWFTGISPGGAAAGWELLAPDRDPDGILYFRAS